MTFKETIKQPLDWKSIVITAIAIIAFTKGCGNDFISAHPDVKKIHELETTVTRLEKVAEKFDNSQRQLEKQVAILEATNAK